MTHCLAHYFVAPRHPIQIICGIGKKLSKIVGNLTTVAIHCRVHKTNNLLTRFIENCVQEVSCIVEIAGIKYSKMVFLNNYLYLCV